MSGAYGVMRVLPLEQGGEVSTRRDILRIASAQHGVFSLAQASEAGLSRYAAHRAVASGAWLRVHAGVFAIAGLPLSTHGRLMAAVLATRLRAVVSHRSAAFLHALPGGREVGPPEVMIADRSGRSIRGVKIHRPRITFDIDVRRVDGIPVTSVLRTMFDLATVLPRQELGRAFDDACRRGLMTVDEVRSRLVELQGRPVPGLRRMRHVASLRFQVDGSESVLETKFFRVITAAGLPAPVPQYEVRRPDGTFVARVDFAYPNHRLAIELDGYAYHNDRAAFERDHMRDVELRAAGWTPLHFTDRNLTKQRRWVVTQVRRFLEHERADFIAGSATRSAQTR